MARPVHITPPVTTFVSSAVALSLALAQTPSVAVLPVDAAEAGLPAADVAALRDAAVDAVKSGDSHAQPELLEELDAKGVERADAAWLARTLTPHGVSHWLVTRVRGRSRTYDVEVELWEVRSERPVATSSESCAICGQAELRDSIESQVGKVVAEIDAEIDTEIDAEIDDARDDRPIEEAPARTLAPRSPAHARAAAPADRTEHDASMQIGGYASLSAGAVALVTGSTLIALDGREHSVRCRSADETVIDADGDCRYVHRTLAGGISLVVGGLLASAGGITLLVLDARRRRRAEISMRIGNRRVAVVGRF